MNANSNSNPDPQPASAALLTAQFLYAHGVRRVFGLQGGHIQPIWDHLARMNVEIVDVRHEAAAVHMAHAHAELTGTVGVALVTAGPGVTNTVTAVANAFVSRASVLVLGGCAPRPQANMGALQDIPHTAIMEPITRRARTLRQADQVLRELSEAWALAEGDGGDPGPVYIEIPTDVLRTPVAPRTVLSEYLRPTSRRRTVPAAEDTASAAALIASCRRPALVSGRGARACSAELERFLEVTGAAYLDTQESRCLVSEDHPGFVGAVRSAVMSECDLLITVGRRLDYQLGYGSPAAFPNAKILRISDTSAELIDNRRGEVELLGSPDLVLDAITALLVGGGHDPETQWRDELRARHVERARRYKQGLSKSESGADGLMHPNQIFAATESLGLDDGIVVADGGDLLSFARLGASGSAYLDAGAFGCLGIGVPFAIAAALENPEKVVLSFNGDGAFGFNAMEIDTAVRHGAKIVVIVANNRAWNIERYDQQTNYGLIAGTELGDADYAAMARALGAHGERVTDPNDLTDAIKRAVDAAPAVIQVDVTRDAISPDAQKGLGYVPDYQALLPWNDIEIERRENS
ncbi:thiamine pyrophosphate-binding protein [Rhodococcus sp. WS3]|uniref:thiamine pyrophosphate-binding protein n=1 Tax=unclassified Rhodococcus (in: high G+C Gram-positive bacteria) TaxID=192944 RepID=UPI0005D445AC|nr:MULTISPECIES: thiamine pyrophosphate-binding protein [unclassified Rhodococcus (in: high G+C Gram-positive bacteria)]KJF19152.1 Acetolactate synthase large subunit IlvB1 [Rhodococcus sp. AD45]ROZ42850.1 thiamine pyrophosphate-binding protein [Rhodococcus sp. WS3]RZL20905.1 MAG: thiamine pyrophosphate-binding protein [Rhodococcus sp. (in: high G+C Gram-positive bacteria)]